MGRTALVTVPDEGAAWTVRDALAAGGVTCEVEQVRLEHAYSANALARQLRIFVDDGQLSEARRLLAALEGELANHEEDLAAEALGAGRVAEEEAVAEAARKATAIVPPTPPKLRWGLLLGLLVPLPVVCLYARARVLGLLFLVTFFVGLAQLPALDEVDYQTGLEAWPLGTLQVAAKGLDLLVGLALLLAQRRRPST